jgi:hypothetical protein
MSLPLGAFLAKEVDAITIITMLSYIVSLLHLRCNVEDIDYHNVMRYVYPTEPAGT